MSFICQVFLFTCQIKLVIYFQRQTIKKSGGHCILTAFFYTHHVKLFNCFSCLFVACTINHKTYSLVWHLILLKLPHTQISINFKNVYLIFGTEKPTLYLLRVKNWICMSVLHSALPTYQPSHNNNIHVTLYNYNNGMFFPPTPVQLLGWPTLI